jgi:SAM-dependent methyltransferase
MHYDPIKRKLGVVFNTATWTRVLFYQLLDLLLLRSWHIQRALRQWKGTQTHAVQVLDAGFGFGQYTYRMAKSLNYQNIDAVDLKDEQVADCDGFFKKVNISNVHFQTGDLTAFVRPEKYDLVLCVDVMEHIEEDVQVLTNYCQSLKKGGMLLISTPSDQGGSDVHDDGETSFIEEHVRDGYGVDDMANKLKTAGFSKWDIQFSYGRWGRISWLLSMKYPMLMLNKTSLFFIIITLYYLATYPFAFVFNALDVRVHNPKGTGLIVKAWK